MPWWNRGAAQLEPQEVVAYDDGGSGLFDACVARFADRGWMIECDSRHSVWVRSPEASYAVGLAPWVLRKHPSIDAVLNEVEDKVSAAEDRRSLARACRECP